MKFVKRQRRLEEVGSRVGLVYRDEHDMVWMTAGPDPTKAATHWVVLCSKDDRRPPGKTFPFSAGGPAHGYLENPTLVLEDVG